MDTYTDLLSQYMDGDLDDPTRLDVAAHLESCSECRTIVAELKRVASLAHGLDDRPPSADLWPGIAERIGASRRVLPIRNRRRTISLSLPQLAAASVVLVAVTAGLATLGSETDRGAPIAASSSVGDARFAGSAGSELDLSVAELEAVVSRGRSNLDPQTLQVIEESLRQIDEAIGEARRALAADTASMFLEQHLTNTLRVKLEFLRQTQSLIAAASL